MLLDQCIFRDCKDLDKGILIQILQFYSDRESALQLRDQIGRFRSVERACSDKQDMVCFDRSVFRIDDTSLNDGQYVSLHAFSRNVSTASVDTSEISVGGAEKRRGEYFYTGDIFRIEKTAS